MAHLMRSALVVVVVVCDISKGKRCGDFYPWCRLFLLLLSAVAQAATRA